MSRAASIVDRVVAAGRVAASSAVNGAWMLSCRREHGRFLAATADVASAQRHLLGQLVAANANTDFGRRHGLDRCSLDGPDVFADFGARVPITTAEAFAADVARIADGEPNVLTAEPVTVLQPTSGSTGGRKLIPLTATVQQQFQRAIAAWIADLFAARPGIRRGRAYWSISPAMAPEPPTAGGIRVGFADDTEYLSGLERLAVSRVLAVPADVVTEATVDSFRRATLAHLVLAPDLALISVWSPTFLTTLIDELLTEPDEVLALAATVDRRAAGRAAEVLNGGGTPAERLAGLWPRLDTVSCWADGSAAGFVPAVERLFPTVALQPKGLLATEAFVSFPLVGRDGAALAARSHVFEFLPVAADDGPLLAHQLTVGERYEPLVTTGAGLYRYRLGDVVEVVGHAGTCPLIRFVGRAATADLVGEKLDEAFVTTAIDDTFGSGAGSNPLLVPAPAPTPPRYVLLVDGSTIDGTRPRSLAADLDRRLRANPHYAYARDLGQLAEVEVVGTGPAVTPQRMYEAAMVGRGVRVGDIKPVTLVTSPEVASDMRAALPPTLGNPGAVAAP